MANAMTGMETASIQRRVREVMTDRPPSFVVSGFSRTALLS
jgi:hypothetical protein